MNPITWSPALSTIVWPPVPDWIFSNWLALVGLLAFAELYIGALFCMWMWLDRPLSLAAVGEA